MVREGEMIKYGPLRPREPAPYALEEAMKNVSKLRRVEEVLDDYREFLEAIGRGVALHSQGDEFMEDLKANLRLLKARFNALKRKKIKK